jgi:hypothetical protein
VSEQAKREVLPDYQSPYTVAPSRVNGLFWVIDKGKYQVSAAMLEHQAQALARVLNSHDDLLAPALKMTVLIAEWRRTERAPKLSTILHIYDEMQAAIAKATGATKP